jgi:hypothetical protein
MWAIQEWTMVVVFYSKGKKAIERRLLLEDLVRNRLTNATLSVTTPFPRASERFPETCVTEELT